MQSAVVIVVLLLAVGDVPPVVYSQSTGVTPDGQPFICVLPGTCPTTSNTIDPRIVTPANGTVPNGSCPAGFVPCFGVTGRCGTRAVTPTPRPDGLAVPGAYPWQAYLQNATNPLYSGSGVLVDNYHVITAAHKVALSVANPSSVRVIMGVYNPTTPVNTQTSLVQQIIIHPNYSSTTLRNDIAILRLQTPIFILPNTTNINTACLADGNIPLVPNPFVGQRCVVSGWGQTSFTSNDAPTTPMKEVFVTITDYNTCRTSYSRILSNVDVYLDQNEICAGGEAMRDACTHDGGSPLVCFAQNGVFYVAGLVIWGKNCGQPGVYGVYVSLPAYRAWIAAVLATT